MLLVAMMFVIQLPFENLNAIEIVSKVETFRISQNYNLFLNLP